MRSLSGRQDQFSSPSYMRRDRKSTRLNSSHEWISYAVFCLKKKKKTNNKQEKATQGHPPTRKHSLPQTNLSGPPRNGYPTHTPRSTATHKSATTSHSQAPPP